MKRQKTKKQPSKPKNLRLKVATYEAIETLQS